MKKKIEPGDVIGVPLSDDVAVAGLVLYVSKQFRNGIMVGFYNRPFRSIEDININELAGEFVDTPNYVIKDVITEGDWKRLGHSPDLLHKAVIPELRVAYDIYQGDQLIKKVDLDDFKNYTELGMAGGKFVENRLRKKFLA